MSDNGFESSPDGIGDQSLPSAEVHQAPDADTAVCRGDWSATGIARLARRKPRLDAATRTVDLSGVARFDTTGAVFLNRLLASVPEAVVVGQREAWTGLLELVREEGQHTGQLPAAKGGEGRLSRLGRWCLRSLYAGAGFLTFIGEAAVDVLRHFPRLRWRQFALELQRAGVNALPIVALLCFLVGIVMAYQGGSTLQIYGANIFLVDLIGITMLREMAPLIVAIIVAGRTGSAYAAELGTMRLTEEVDALRSMGVSPYEMLVTPKLAALIIALPLLTFWADGAGMLGGLVVAAGYYGISPTTFIGRLADVVDVSHFWIGVGKAPVFAALIAVIGCFRGLEVSGSAAAVGRATTISVVQAIFAVIMADALFSIAFQLLGI